MATKMPNKREAYMLVVSLKKMTKNVDQSSYECLFSKFVMNEQKPKRLGNLYDFDLFQNFEGSLLSSQVLVEKNLEFFEQI